MYTVTLIPTKCDWNLSNAYTRANFFYRVIELRCIKSLAFIINQMKYLLLWYPNPDPMATSLVFHINSKVNTKSGVINIGASSNFFFKSPKAFTQSSQNKKFTSFSRCLNMGLEILETNNGSSQPLNHFLPYYILYYGVHSPLMLNTKLIPFFYEDFIHVICWDYYLNIRHLSLDCHFSPF